jgi:NAD+ diphosphatase
MIHEIEPHHFDNVYPADAELGDNDYLFVFKDRSLLIKEESGQEWIPQFKDFPELKQELEHGSEKYQLIPLFRVDEQTCYLSQDSKLSRHLRENHYIYKEIQFFRDADPFTGWLSVTAFHLRNWYEQNQYCGKCGSVTKHKDDERALECRQCGHLIYPRISPAIIVALISGDKILLARGRRSSSGWYSLIAGYVDVGESAEQAVIREVKEEVGLDIRNIRYYGSQPWPLSGSLMLGYVAEADETQLIHLQEEELQEAGWFRRDSLPEYSPAQLSIGGEMIAKFEQGEL